MTDEEILRWLIRESTKIFSQDGSIFVYREPEPEKDTEILRALGIAPTPIPEVEQ